MQGKSSFLHMSYIRLYFVVGQCAPLDNCVLCAHCLGRLRLGSISQGHKGWGLTLSALGNLISAS